MLASSDGYLQNLDEWVCSEKKIVTYKWLSNQLKVPSNTAKQMLHSFAARKGDDVATIYVVSGITKQSNSHKISLVPKDRLEDAKKDLQSLLSIHVYSVQAVLPKDSAELFTVNHMQSLQMVKDDPLDNPILDNRFSALQFTKAKDRRKAPLPAIPSPLGSPDKENKPAKANAKPVNKRTPVVPPAAVQSSNNKSKAGNTAAPAVGKPKAGGVNSRMMTSFFKPVKKGEAVAEPKVASPYKVEAKAEVNGSNEAEGSENQDSAKQDESQPEDRMEVDAGQEEEKARQKEQQEKEKEKEQQAQKEAERKKNIKKEKQEKEAKNKRKEDEANKKQKSHRRIQASDDEEEEKGTDEGKGEEEAGVQKKKKENKKKAATTPTKAIKEDKNPKKGKKVADAPARTDSLDDFDLESFDGGPKKRSRLRKGAKRKRSNADQDVEVAAQAEEEKTAKKEEDKAYDGEQADEQKPQKKRRKVAANKRGKKGDEEDTAAPAKKRSSKKRKVEEEKEEGEEQKPGKKGGRSKKAAAKKQKEDEEEKQDEAQEGEEQDGEEQEEEGEKKKGGRKKKQEEAKKPGKAKALDYLPQPLRSPRKRKVTRYIKNEKGYTMAVDAWEEIPPDELPSTPPKPEKDSEDKETSSVENDSKDSDDGGDAPAWSTKKTKSPSPKKVSPKKAVPGRQTNIMSFFGGKK